MEPSLHQNLLLPCPHLPEVGDARFPASALAAFRDGERGADFYQQALTCGQSRWLEGLPAQALLMLNRAMGAVLNPERDGAVLALNPIPYRAVAWILRRGEAFGFLGNPRRHFQHLATRMSGHDIERRRARAWACWEIAKRVNADWEADAVQIMQEGVIEPTEAAIRSALSEHGLPGEEQEWHRAMIEA